MSLSQMEMGEDPLDPQDVERAKAFWAEEDVDQVFNGVLEYVEHLKSVLKENTATDKDFVQALKLLESLNPPPAPQDPSVVQVVIGSDELLVDEFSHHRSPPPSKGLSSSAAPPAGQEELLPPLTPVQLEYQPHTCCKACLPSLPSIPQCTPAFWGQNPLKVPLLCGFKRLSAAPLMMSPEGRDEGAEPAGCEDKDDWDVVYKAPCGQSLRNHDDVMCFLLASESYDILQVDFFTFNPSVRLDPPLPLGPQEPEMDLSRGMEPTPVQLCVGDGGARPAEFRYRKERWPHGCFLSRGPALFAVCCDCTDGCSDARRCACAAATAGDRRYAHLRLEEPVATGVYECGPWCGCVRARCQNRLVQRGIRVRLQVFQTADCGWGVRCRDDLDRGTFVCMYAGVMLRRSLGPTEAPPPKLMRADLPSDDEVQVVTEWLPPPVLEGRSTVLEPTKETTSGTTTEPPLHVPVIQRPTDTQKVLVGGPEDPSPAARESCDQSPVLERMVATAAGGPELNGTSTKKRAMNVEDVYFLDATKEGNVSRFINHSCLPNLFVQNVFTDCHDPDFPTVAFFTSRVVKAGTELTWNYSAEGLGGGNGCRGQSGIEEKLCDMCEVKGSGSPLPPD